MKNRQIHTNYNLSKTFIESLLAKQDTHYDDFYRNELTETALSQPTIVKLLNKDVLDPAKYELEYLEAINDSRNWLKSLNYNFKEISLDALNEEYGFETSNESTEDEHTSDESIDLNNFPISDDNKSYLKKLCQQLSINQKNHIIQNLMEEPQHIEDRVEFMRTLFPEIPKSTPDFLTVDTISKEQVLLIFKHILIGSIKKFPLLFLQNKAEDKIITLVSFLRDKILKVDAESFYKNYSIDILYNYKLAGVARYLNYSWYRLNQLLNPDDFLPWQLGKVNEGYWENAENRIKAIRWVVEEYYNIKSNQLWKIIRDKTFSRNSFGKLGLSYLYNTYYNSMLKCVKEAYPNLNYWEIGIYPNGFWESEDAKEQATESFKWMLSQEGIHEDNLIKAIELKWINRQLFSKYNLATMFDYCFNKNLFELVDATYPNRYNPWEVGNVKQVYWENEDNHMKAIRYFLKEIHQSEMDVDRLLERNAFKKSSFKQSKLANFFKNQYNNNPDKIFYRLLKPVRLVRASNYRIYKKLKRQNQTPKENKIIRLLKYGFNLPLVDSFEKKEQQRLARKLRIRKQIMNKEN